MAKNYEEVAEYCATCVYNLINLPKSRCEFVFGGKAQRCALCTRRANGGTDKPCIPVCEGVKGEAAKLCASAKQLSGIDEELEKLVRKMEDMFDQKKKKKLQEMIDDCKKRHDAAAQVHKENGSDFQAAVKKHGHIEGVLQEAKAEAEAADPENKKMTKTRAPKPVEPQLSDGQKIILGLRGVVQTFDHTRNEMDKARHAAEAGFKENKLTTEEKYKVANLLRKVYSKLLLTTDNYGEFMSVLMNLFQVDKFAPLRHDSGDEDLSDLESGYAKNGNYGDGGMSTVQDGDFEMMDTA